MVECFAAANAVQVGRQLKLEGSGMRVAGEMREAGRILRIEVLFRSRESTVKEDWLMVVMGSEVRKGGCRFSPKGQVPAHGEHRYNELPACLPAYRHKTKHGP